MCMLTELLGDLKWFLETFHLPYNYKTVACCWLCEATKTNHLSAFDFRREAAWQAHPRSHEQYWAEVGHTLPVCKLPGFHLSALKIDLMHVALLGILQWGVGCTLFDMCLEGKWYVQPGGGWKARVGLQLRRAYNDFRGWLRAEAKTASQPLFTVASLDMPNLSAWPYFKGKAANTLLVAEWLAEVSKAAADLNPNDMPLQWRASMLYGFVETFRLCQNADMWLTATEALQLQQRSDAALFGYQALAANAANAALARYPMKPKHHAWDHCIRQAVASRRNPLGHWTMADEDFIGKVKSVAVATHPNTMHTRVLERYLCRFFAEVTDLKESLRAD